MKRAPAALTFIISALLLLHAVPGSAMIRYVDVNGSGPYQTIQAAINDSSDGDTVLVAAGVYTCTEWLGRINFNGTSLVLMSESGPDVTIIDIEGMDDGIIPIGIEISSYEDSTTVVDGFTITNASAEAIYIVYADPVIRNCIITGNDSLGTEHGGGIVLGFSSSKILNCTINNNHCSGGACGIMANACPDLLVQDCDIFGNSGALFGGGISLVGCTARIIDCTISDNHLPGAGANGGGIYAANCDSVLIENCVISGNSASASGGGIYLNNAPAAFSACTISSNTSSEIGGGIYAGACDDLLIEDCTLTNNSTAGSGGGIYVIDCFASFVSCDVNDNETTITGTDIKEGGGIFAKDCDSLTVQDCEIERNTSADNGGGIYLETSTVSVLNCTIRENNVIGAGNHGGGINALGGDSLLVQSCVIARNSAGHSGGGAYLIGAPAAFIGCSIIDNTSQYVGGLATQHTITVRYCDILGNTAEFSTGGIRVGNITSVGLMTVENCTIAYNTAPGAGAGISATGSYATITKTIIAFNNGNGFHVGLGSPQILCSDVFGNSGDNYSGITDQTGINDNISADPLFCVQPSYDTFIYSASPCAAVNSPCGELIGRSGVACTSEADLVFASVEFDDYYPPVDGNIQATIKVRNVGHKTAYNFFTGYYYDLLTPPVIGQSGNIFFHTDSLAAGDSLTHWIPNISNDEVEEWASYFQVDYTNAVAEIDENNNVSGPHLINWTIPPTDGWPVAGGGDFHSSPVIALLDNDPRTKEVVIGCDDGYLYAYSAYGTTLPGQWPVNLGSPVYSSPAAGNIIGDYHNEIVVGCGMYLYAFDWAGTQLWTFGPSQVVTSTPALVDLDDDGLLEILFSRKTLIGDIQLYALEGDGTMCPGSWPVPLVGTAVTSPAVGDIDQNGTIEIAVISSGMDKIEDKSYVHLFNADGTYFNVMNWPVLLDTIVTCSPVMGNVTVDPKLELIAGGLNGMIYAINNLGNIWPVTPQVQGSVDMSLALAQLDADDQQEIIAASRYWVDTPFPGFFRSEVTAIDNDGTIMSSWPQSAGSWITGLVPPSPVAFYERILHGSPDGNVYGWERSAAAILGFPFDVEGRVYSSPAVGDLDGDGQLDMVVATSADSVYAFDLGIVEDFESSANLCWPFYRNDKTRSGCYFVDPPTDAGEAEDFLPSATALKSIHPNPFNPATTITFDISRRTRVRIAIYDTAGRAVCLLKDDVVEGGRHEVVWNGRNSAGASVATGVYFCRLNAGEITQTEKMVLLR